MGHKLNLLSIFFSNFNTNFFIFYSFFFCLSDVCHTTTICHILIGVLPLSTNDNNKDGDDNDSDEGWEMRAGAQDADASQAPGTFFILFSTFLILH